MKAAPVDRAEEVTKGSSSGQGRGGHQEDAMTRKVVLQSCMGSDGCGRPKGQVAAIHSLETDNSNIQDRGPVKSLCQ